MSKYINADTAASKIRRLYDTAKNDNEDYIIAKAVEAVCDAPAADVEPVRHGRWEGTEDVNGEGTRIRCSKCGDVWHGWPYSVEEWAKMRPYCSNCGAKMDGGNSNEQAD